MSEFNRKEFGERIKNYRLKNGLSQEALAISIHKSKAIISRYESGAVLPDAEDISLICRALDIYEADLFANNMNTNITINDKSINPFNTNQIYIYFNAYNFRTKKFNPDMYILELEQKQNICKAKFVDSHDGRIYSEGYLKCNDEIVFVILENYKPTSSRTDAGLLEINICNGTEGLMLGAYFGTNAQCEPSMRKCYFSKKKVKFTDKMFKALQLNEHEREILDTQNAMYLDIFNN